MPWQSEVDSVLVVHSDGQDIITQQVEALCEFYQLKMQPLFENGLGAGLVKKTVMGYVTPARFSEDFAEPRERRKSMMMLPGSRRACRSRRDG